MARLVARGIRPVVGVVVRQRHVTHAQTVKVAQRKERIFNRVAALDAHQGGDLPLPLGATDIGDRRRHHDVAGVAFRRTIDDVDHIHRAPRRSALLRVFLIHVDGKKLPRHAALLHAREIRVIFADG
jgi:hypothetical protein